ncbi:MAG TPA: hypothetical protein VFP36_14545 [Usitatibacter sp.]|nr:hypothetical protein [Usitatibacter sp.]
MQIKSLMIVAACAFVLPAFAADTDKAATTEKPKAEAKADVKKPAAVREKIAGEVKAPVEKKEAVDVVSDTSFSLKNSRWVRDEEHEYRR